MHFLDDRQSMSVLFHERPLDYLLLARLALHGGEADLNPIHLARGLSTHTREVNGILRRLEAAGRIERTTFDKWRIRDFPSSRQASLLPEPEGCAAPVATVDESRPVVRLSPPFRPFKVSADAHRVLDAYHRAIATGGAYGEALDAIQSLLNDGWTAERLLASIAGYRRYRGADDKQFAKRAFNFFRPVHGRFYGAQFAMLAVPPKKETFALPPEVAAIRERLREQENAQHARE